MIKHHALRLQVTVSQCDFVCASQSPSAVSDSRCRWSGLSGLANRLHTSRCTSEAAREQIEFGDTSKAGAPLFLGASGKLRFHKMFLTSCEKVPAAVYRSLQAATTTSTTTVPVLPAFHVLLANAGKPERAEKFALMRPFEKLGECRHHEP